MCYVQFLQPSCLKFQETSRKTMLTDGFFNMALTGLRDVSGHWLIVVFDYKTRKLNRRKWRKQNNGKKDNEGRKKKSSKKRRNKGRSHHQSNNQASRLVAPLYALFRFNQIMSDWLHTGKWAVFQLKSFQTQSNFSQTWQQRRISWRCGGLLLTSDHPNLT